MTTELQEVAITDDFESDGQALTTELASTESVRIYNKTGATAIEYQVDGGAWTRIERQQSATVSVDLVAVDINVRRTLYSEASIQIAVTCEGSASAASSGTAVPFRLATIPGNYYRQEGATEDYSFNGWTDCLFFTRIIITNTVFASRLLLVLGAGNTGTKAVKLGLYSMDGLTGTLVGSAETENGGFATLDPRPSLTPGVYLIGAALGPDAEGATHEFVCMTKASHMYGEFGADSNPYLHSDTNARMGFLASHDFEDDLPASISLLDLDLEERIPLMVLLTSATAE